jgi:hypothetical protein
MARMERGKDIRAIRAIRGQVYPVLWSIVLPVSQCGGASKGKAEWGDATARAAYTTQWYQENRQNHGWQNDGDPLEAGDVGPGRAVPSWFCHP